jgi:hypothetical protein
MKNIYWFSFNLLFCFSSLYAQEDIDAVFVSMVDETCFSLEYQRCMEMSYSQCALELAPSVELCRGEIALPIVDDLASLEVVEYTIQVADCALVKHFSIAVERTKNETLCE